MRRRPSFIFAMGDAMNWTINGRTYEMDVVADDERVRFGDVEVAGSFPTR